MGFRGDLALSAGVGAGIGGVYFAVGAARKPSEYLRRARSDRGHEGEHYPATYPDVTLRWRRPVAPVTQAVALRVFDFLLEKLDEAISVSPTGLNPLTAGAATAQRSLLYGLRDGTRVFRERVVGSAGALSLDEWDWFNPRSNRSNFARFVGTQELTTGERLLDLVRATDTALYRQAYYFAGGRALACTGAAGVCGEGVYPYIVVQVSAALRRDIAEDAVHAFADLGRDIVDLAGGIVVDVFDYAALGWTAVKLALGVAAGALAAISIYRAVQQQRTPRLAGSRQQYAPQHDPPRWPSLNPTTAPTRCYYCRTPLAVGQGRITACPGQEGALHHYTCPPGSAHAQCADLDACSARHWRATHKRQNW